MWGACPTPSLSSSSAGTVGATVDSLAANEMQSAGVPGMAVGLAKQGSIIYAQGYGYADVSDCQPTQSDTSFRLASVTKTFTAAAMLQLQSTGALDLDTPVITYLPAYPFDPRITVRMLLNHISGLADYINQPALFPQDATWEMQGVAEQTVLAAIAQAPLQFTPGSEYQYSNSNYFVLGCILETVTSETYLDYLSMKIFGPLGLPHTSTTQPLAAALPYEVSTVGYPVEAPIWASSTFFSVGALWSDVQDLASFDAALFAGQVLPSAQFMEMVTPPSTPSSQYAMGWVRTTMLNRPFVWHNGGLPGVAAFNGLFLDDGFSVSILMNAPPSTGITAFAQDVIQVVCTTSPTTC
jgi:CubicO group peptidase (beta-lactamase class C family)